MAIGTYAQLNSAIVEWISRDEDTTLVARVPDFIMLAETKLNRVLFVPQMEKRSTAAIDTSNSEPEYVSLPGDFQTMRRVRLSSASGKPQLEYKTPAGLDEWRTANGDATGQPRYFTIIGDELELCPTPDGNYTLEMVYRSYIPALTASNTTNWLLTLAPDIYLYGALLESAPYMKEDERIGTWATGFTTCLDNLNSLGRAQSFGAGPLVMRTSGYTP